MPDAARRPDRVASRRAYCVYASDTPTGQSDNAQPSDTQANSIQSEDAQSEDGQSESVRANSIQSNSIQSNRARSDYARLVAGRRNLFLNPSFEQGDKLPRHWAIAGDSQAPVTLGFDSVGPVGLGQRSARLHVPSGAKQSWRGWQQAVAVKPGRTYFLAGWVKCHDLAGEVRLHVHLHDVEGKLSNDNPMRSAGPKLVGTADWTLLSGMFTMPADAASLTVHLTSNTSGTVWHNSLLLAEVLPGTLTRLEGRPTDRPDGLDVWPVNAVVKVFPDDVPPQSAPTASISLAGNEAEPLQLALRSGRDLQGVRVEVDPPVGPGGAKLDDVQIGIVGYVPIDHPTNYYRSDTPAWYRKIPTSSGGCDGWPGMWPDPLLPRNHFDLTANSTQPVWVTISSGKGKPPGRYKGRVRFVQGDKTLASLPFSVRLWDFTLPDANHLAAIYDVRLGPAGSRYWGKSLDEAYPEIIRFMAERRLCPDTIRPAPVIKYENGKAVGDFAEFDKAAELYFNQLKLPRAYTPWNFYLFGWGHPPHKKFGEQPYPGKPPFEDADRGRLRPEFKRAYQACLKLYWDHLKAKGWQKKIVLYISDEPFYSQEHIRLQMKALCEMIHEVDPAIPIYSSTWRHVPDWDGYLDVWGIGHYGCVPTEQIAKLRAAGDRIWFTTDGHMCTDTPYCAFERLLPHYCFKYGAEAYEFWGVGWLTYDPYRFGWHAYIHQTMEPGKSTWVRYPNGDGFFMYPGKPIGHAGPVSSIRMEQAREGVEDYEYLYLLRQRIATAKSSGRDTTSAEAALQKAAALITIPNPGGRYSSKVLPNPDALFELKQALGEAIEGLR